MNTAQAYDRYNRDPKARSFYASAAWQRCRDIKLADTPWCENCENPAQHVHHKQPISTPEGWERRLDHSGLMALCIPCHNQLEGAAPPAPHIAGILATVEDEQWRFDEAAADRPIRFIERFCRHYEGQFAGQPFILHPAQRQIIRDVYGWKDRATGLRRFSQVWFEAAAGAGKSPLLAALGIYGLTADGEPGAQVYSVASNFGQARVVFDSAKRFIEASQELSCRLRVTQYEISHAASKSFWRIISGKGPKAGLRPSLVLADELHEWPSRDVYDSVQGRMSKRQQPLFVCATNAGENRNSLCWQLHEEAVGVLAGTRTNPKLYPIVWAADPKAEIDDPAAWRAANKLLGTTVTEAKVREECERAIGDPALEARFRRLYLSQWVQGANKWLDIARWHIATAPIDPEAIKGAPLYVGMDLSQCEDLCAVVYVWVTPDRFYVDSHFYLPADVAKKYEDKDQIPYSRWADAGAITLLGDVTISPAVRQRIADEILTRSKPYKLESVCYDRAHAEETVARLAASGAKCLPIAQGWTVAGGCAELDRRLKERSVTIAPNPVLAWNAEIVEIKSDDRGNYWPVKPKAKGRYAGTRSQKIDGISALVTVLTEARKHNFPTASKKWNGSVWLI